MYDSKIHDLRVALISSWVMLVDSGAVKSATMPREAVEELLRVDAHEDTETVLRGISSSSDAYLAKRRCRSRVEFSVNLGAKVIVADAGVELEVFDHWREKMNHKRTKPTQARIGIIRARLREGFTPQELKRAIDGLAESKFHVEGGYTDLKYAIKDEATIRRNIDLVKLTFTNDPWAAAMKRTGRA